MQTSRSMADVRAVVDEHVRAFSKAPLFLALNQSSDIEDLRAIAPHGYFFVFGFQDALRITHDRITDPTIREIARSLKGDDAGHDDWFLSDMAQFGTTRDVRWIFGEEHHLVRDVVYGLISQVLNATTDVNRLVVPLVFEAAAAVVFDSMIGVTRRSKFEHLKYFAPMHEDAEKSHDAFKESSQQKLDEIVFSQADYDEVTRIVARCFECFTDFATHLDNQLRRGREHRH
jgi:hypothetical protein